MTFPPSPRLSFGKRPLARSALWIALALTSCLAPGCASERAPINRVQANALEKSFFVGELGDPSDDPEFFWRNFVVDASESQSLVGIGSWSGVDRIRWEITEKTLFARRAYVQNPGADDKGAPGSLPNGTVVAAYPIESHFDIVREYNPSTGEELNVISENTSDQPWHARKYMRVDWSVNLVDTPLWFDMFAGKVFGNIDVTPLAYYVGDAGNPDAPHFEPDEGYFDITSKFWVEPTTTLNGGQEIPACLLAGRLTGTAVESCDPQEATIRSSYWRVDRADPDEDFEPFENSRAPLDIVGNPGGIGDSFSAGIITPPRVEWDPQYGYTDANLRRNLHIHDIWEQSHQTRGSCQSDADCSGGRTCLDSGTCSVPCSYEARGDADDNGTDDQCENADTGYSGSSGAQCSSRNRCTIPVRDRVVSPVGYWMNVETPEDLTDPVGPDGLPTDRGPTEDIIYSWNQLLKHSVAKAREIECRRTGDGDRDECHEEFFEPDTTEMVSYGGWGIEKVKPMENILAICHNPVRDYDAPLCGEPGSSARVGDLRKNFLFYWPYASRAPWGGIANWNADPLTGQILGASATTMGRSATLSAAMTRDIIMVVNGELSMSDITGGTPAYLYEKELQDGRVTKALTPEELEERVSAIDIEHVQELLAPKAPNGSPADKMRQMLDYEAQSVTGLLDADQLKYDAIVDKLRGTSVEADLIDPSSMVDLAGLLPTDQMSDSALDMVSPLRGQDSYQLSDLERLTSRRFAARGICFTDSEVANIGNHDVQGVARYFARKYSDDALLEDDAVQDRVGSLEGAERSEMLSRIRAESIYDELWKETYKGIQLHEVGHSLGMLHQFASSYDSTNFNPQYWQLRTQEGEAMRSCDGDPRTGNTDSADEDSCMGPRYLDPETDDELGRKVSGSPGSATYAEPRPGINYFASTSTMEYQNERFFETVGLGQYDHHTMNVLYGRVIQTFDPDAPTGLSRGEQLPFSYRHYSQLIDDHLIVNADTDGIVDPDTPFQTLHYTEAARRMKLYDASRCRDATEQEMARAQWRIVHGKVCSPPPKDYAHWNDFDDVSPPMATAPSQNFPSQDVTLVAPRVAVRPGAPGAGNIRWPYRWGAETNSYPHANSSDAGADIYELTIEAIRKFDYSYPLSYFRRAQRDWYYWGIPARTASRFFERLRVYHWGAVSAASRLRAEGTEAYQSAVTDDDDQRPAAIASAEMFNALARALLMPQIGSYWSAPDLTQSDATRPLWDTLGTGDPDDPNVGLLSGFRIDASTGRYIDPSFDFGPSGGGSWDWFSWIYRTGFGTEKVDAARTLMDGRSAFFTISRENYLDGRNLVVNFRSDMPKAVDRLIGGILAKDWESVAPYVERGFENPEVKLLDFNADAPSRPSADDSFLLFPNLSYRQQLGALIWGHVFSRLSADLGLANKMRIFVDGMQDISLADAEQIRFTDPESGFTYIARRYGTEMLDGREVETGIASRMIERANLLLVEAYEVERDQNGAPVLDAYGQPTLVVDGSGHPVRVDDDTNKEYNRLRNYVNLIDANVEINRLVGFGPLGL